MPIIQHPTWCEITLCRPLFGDDPYGPVLHRGATATFGARADGLLIVELQRIEGESTVVQVDGATLDLIIAQSLAGYLQRIVRLAVGS